MPAKLVAELKVATPLLLVTAVPTEVPLRKNVTVFPLTPLAPDVRVADSARSVLPPYIPVAADAASEVGVGRLKVTETVWLVLLIVNLQVALPLVHPALIV